MRSSSLVASRGRRSWQAAWQSLVGLVVAMWVIFVLQAVTSFFDPYGGMTRLGVQPRVLDSLLIGPLFMPLLHGSWGHLTSNTIALLPLVPLFFLAHHRVSSAWWRFAALWLGSGVFLWLIGPGNSVHIGASALIYALTGYLVVYGFRGGHWLASVVAVLIVIFQAGALWSGLLPSVPGVSYSGHWSGLIVGAGIGFAVDRKG